MTFRLDDFFGTVVKPEGIAIPRAQLLCRYLRSKINPFVRLVEIRAKKGQVTLILEMELGLSQKKIFPIKNQEPIAITLNEKDEKPEVLAMREDFPHTPHLNLNDFDFPKSLCLYELSWDEAKLGWTAAGFIERIREWLEKTSRGELHQDDQALEPFIITSHANIILPHGFTATKADRAAIILIETHSQGDQTTLIATRGTAKSEFDKKFPPFLGVFFDTPPAVHGLIQKHPKTIHALHEVLLPIGFDLLKELKKNLQHWASEGLFQKKFYDARLAIFLTIPHKRNSESDPESTQTWVFSSLDKINDIGKDVGIWAHVDNQTGVPGYLIKQDPAKNGSNTRLHTLNPVFRPTKTLAAKTNGYEDSDNNLYSIVGLGTLGGSVFMNFVKTGFGKWMLIDSDVFMPHNFLRHIATPSLEGYSKSYALASVANHYFETEDHRYLVKNVLNDQEEISKSLEGTSVILDCSASVPVARALTHEFKSIPAKRASVFLNPSGSDLVFLQESGDRVHRLDALEMQYYRTLCINPELKDHLLTDGQKSRYARSCADVSATIPGEIVSALSSIASIQFRRLAKESKPFAAIWRFDRETLTTNYIVIPTPKLVFKESNGWQIVTDDVFLETLFGLRKQQLPNETGSSIVGHIDIENKVIYPFHILPTPENSTSTRTSFIRGSEGNREALEDILKKTSNAFTYLGEWHSHPNGSGVNPSGDDNSLLKVISSEMHPAGLPGLMIIVEDQQINFIVYPAPGDISEKSQ